MGTIPVFQGRGWSMRRALSGVACGVLIAGGLAAGSPLFETTCVFPITPDNKPNYRIPAILSAPNGEPPHLCGEAQRRAGRHRQSRHRPETEHGPGAHLERRADGLRRRSERVCTDLTVGLDRETGKIWLFFLRDKKQFACFTSADSGATWQGPRSDPCAGDQAGVGHAQGQSRRGRTGQSQGTDGRCGRRAGSSATAAVRATP